MPVGAFEYPKSVELNLYNDLTCPDEVHRFFNPCHGCLVRNEKRRSTWFTSMIALFRCEFSCHAVQMKDEDEDGTVIG